MHYIAMCEYLRIHPVLQCEMVEIKDRPSASGGRPDSLGEQMKTDTVGVGSIGDLTSRLDAMLPR
ncbi:hypothetical protein LLG39_12625 [bacterium]|nr:hypothetical protein [bacterium]